MSKKVKLNVPDECIVNGKVLTFRAPCGSTEATGLLLNDVEYSLIDARGASCKNMESWKAGFLVSILIDTTAKHAYILNSATSSGNSLHSHSHTLIELGAASSDHNHILNNLTGTLALNKGGTGATTIPGAREALGIKSGSYTGTGSNRTFDTGMKNAKIIFIYGTASSNDGNSFSGFLTPQGGVFITEEILKAGLTGQDMLGIRSFGRSSSSSDGYNGYIAYFENGVITLNTNHYSLNENGKTYHYTCF